jgi:hypothetical protein
MASKKTTQVNIRLAPEVREELASIADEEHRTLSGLLTAIILDWLKERQSLVQTSRKPRQKS